MRKRVAYFVEYRRHGDMGDCTEDESAEIKRLLDTADIQEKELLRRTWPLEYNEWCDERFLPLYADIHDEAPTDMDGIRASLHQMQDELRPDST